MTTPRLHSNLSSDKREGSKCPLRELTLPPLIRGPKGHHVPQKTRLLMEKPGTTAAHRHNHAHPPHSWGGGGGGPEGQQHTQYIRRLVDLRDELISQEETGLARALDRLRLHSINNRDAARYRLKIKDPASGESPRVGGGGGGGGPGVQHSSFPRPMLTTVEKFRQMRPQRRPPVIFPLQGKQLIESSPVSTGSTTRVSTEEGSRGGGGGGADPSSASSHHRGVEDTVKANLQRLVQQPTSSIPNIGRKAVPRQESLELKSQSLQNIRNRVFKSTRSHLMSPFMMSPGGGDEEGGGSRLDYSREGSSDGEFQLSPHTYKLGPMTDGDRINMDKLNQYYYVYCMPDTPPTGRRGGGGGGGGGGPQRKSLPHSLPNPCNTPVNGHGQRRGFGGKPVAGGGGMGGGGGGSKTSRRTSSERSHLSRPFSERSILSLVVSSDTELETSSNPRYNNTKLPSDSNPANTNERKTLPIIPDSGEGLPSPTSSSGKKPTEQAFLTQTDPSRDRGLVSTTTSEPRKRHIVIDMPHIIFNAATPDFTIEAGNKIVSQQDTHNHHHGHGHGHGHPTVSERPGVLSKTLKQNEIRHRELQNLLEDVKELNKRTETLSSQAQVPPELESSSSSMLC